MILTVTLNAALDVTHTVDRLVPGTSHRVSEVHRRAGGKGVNVARVLASLGHPVGVTGLAGGATGEALRADLRAAGLRDLLVATAAESRLTFTVVSRATGEATACNEDGGPVTAAEWRGFLDAFVHLLDTEDVEAVVLSGSVPPGTPPGCYAELGRLAGERDVPVLLDADGEALALGVGARPALAKGNAEEVGRATGERDGRAGARRLREAGAAAAVVSLGADGMLADTPDGRFRAWLPEPLVGNPTGAGDAAAAALALGLIAGASWPVRLADAVALSAAAVLSPAAGGFDAEAYRRLGPDVHVEELP